MITPSPFHLQPHLHTALQIVFAKGYFTKSAHIALSIIKMNCWCASMPETNLRSQTAIWMSSKECPKSDKRFYLSCILPKFSVLTKVHGLSLKFSFLLDTGNISETRGTVGILSFVKTLNRCVRNVLSHVILSHFDWDRCLWSPSQITFQPETGDYLRSLDVGHSSYLQQKKKKKSFL